MEHAVAILEVHGVCEKASRPKTAAVMVEYMELTVPGGGAAAPRVTAMDLSLHCTSPYCRSVLDVLAVSLQVIQRYDGNLGRWLSRQKLLWRSGKGLESRLTQLQALGVDIDCVTDIAGHLLHNPQQ